MSNLNNIITETLPKCNAKNIDDKNQIQNPFLIQDNFPKGYFLTPDAMPHLMHFYMQQKRNPIIPDVSSEQADVIEAKFAQTPPKVMKLAKEIKALETKLVLLVVDEGKEPQEVDELLESIAQKRKTLTTWKIECINMFKKTLTKEQYSVLRDIALKSNKK